MLSRSAGWPSSVAGSRRSSRSPRWSGSAGGGTRQPHRARAGAVLRPARTRSGSRGPTGPAYARARRRPGRDSVPASEVDELPRRRGFDADLTSTSSAWWSRPRPCTSGSGSRRRSSTGSCSASATTGAVVMLGLPESLDFEALADRLEDLGYERPDDDTGVWVGGDDLLADDRRRSPRSFSYLALDEDQRLVLASDTSGYLAERRRGGRPATSDRRPTAWPTSSAAVGRAAVGGASTPATRPAARWRWRRPTPPTRRRPTS